MVTCVVTLLYKRATEHPQREWIIWFLDVGKQGIGSSLGHMSNIFMATIISLNANADECEWYCVCYLTDVTLGTFINLSFLTITEYALLNSRTNLALFRFGDYGNPPNFCVWVIQLIIWLIIIMLTKIIIAIFLVFASQVLNYGIQYLFYYIAQYPRVELILVMIVIPFVFNIMAFWITDRYSYYFILQKC